VGVRVFTPGRLAILVIAVVVWAAPVVASAIPIPNNCWHPTRLSPGGGTIPANLPAFRLWPSVTHGNPPRSIDDYGIELRDPSGALIPVTVAAQGVESYLIKATAELPTGFVKLSLLEDCTNPGGPRLTAPVRTDHIFSVNPALPFPTRIGTLDAQVTGYRTYPFECPRITAQIRLQIQPSREAQAFRSALVLTLQTEAGDLDLWPETMPGYGTFERETEAACRDATESSVSKSIEIRAQLPGASRAIEPLRATVNIDCTPRQLPGAADDCAGASPPAGPPADAGADPRSSDASTARPDGGASTARSDSGAGGGCQVGPADPGGLAPMLALAAIAGRLARRRR
jgi:MYXO-CTERM domain-containing protein